MYQLNIRLWRPEIGKLKIVLDTDNNYHYKHHYNNNHYYNNNHHNHNNDYNYDTGKFLHPGTVF